MSEYDGIIWQPIVYDDEDNVSMNEDNAREYKNVYNSSYKEKYLHAKLPFTDPPEDGCWNCLNYDYGKEACTLTWNNMDESYYNPDTDDREPTDCCEDHERDPDAVWEDWFGDE